MRATRTIHIVLASPGDVAKEREAFEDVVKSAERLVSNAGLTLELRKWEDGPPCYGPDGVQARTEDDLEIEKCDILVGIFWRRFGVLNEDGQSRTEREIRKGLALRESGKTRPETMLYFCTRPPEQDSPEDAEEYARVWKFKKTLQEGKVRTKDYKRLRVWKSKALEDLFEIICEVARVAISAGPLPTDVASAFPTQTRSFGYTELVGDINLEIADAAEDEFVTINLLANTNFTNRITDEGLTDITLLTNDRQVIARGRLIAGNAVQFDSVRLIPAERQDFIIIGSRLDAVFRGISSGFRRSYLQIEVALAYRSGVGRLSRHRVTVAWLERPFEFEVDKYEPFRIDGDYVFLAHARELFPNAFKTKEQERGDHGTVVALQFSSLPEDCEVFVTTNNIPVGFLRGSSVTWGLEAFGVTTDANGVPKSGAAPVGTYGPLGGLQISRLPKCGLAAWEVVMAPGYRSTELILGVIVRGLSEGCRSNFRVALGFAPFYSTKAAHMTSRTLPVPRFLPGIQIQHVTFA
jgi:hypothetical protein